ncbi:MAG: SH3 domain-containing protein [Intestinibacillus sp.]
MPTIYLSPSAVGYSEITGEENDEGYLTDQITNAMEPYLSASGIVFGRNQPGMTAEEAIQASNAGMYDVHLALISEDLPSSTGSAPGVTDIFYRSGDENSERLAKIIANNLQTLIPAPAIIRAVPSRALAEVAQTRAPATLVEIAYRGSPESTDWIQNNINNIARNLALSITQYFDVPYIEPAPARPATVDLTSGQLNIRARPAYDAPVVATAQDGDPVSVLGEWNHWFLLRHDDHVGYARSEYITLNY